MIVSYKQCNNSGISLYLIENCIIFHSVFSLTYPYQLHKKWNIAQKMFCVLHVSIMQHTKELFIDFMQDFPSWSLITRNSMFHPMLNFRYSTFK